MLHRDQISPQSGERADHHSASKRTFDFKGPVCRVYLVWLQIATNGTPLGSPQLYEKCKHIRKEPLLGLSILGYCSNIAEPGKALSFEVAKLP